MTTTDALTSGNYANLGGIDASLGSAGGVLGSSNPLRTGLSFETGVGSGLSGLGTITTMTTTQHYTIITGVDGLPIGGTTVMGVGGGVGDPAQDVTYSTNTQEFSYGGEVT